MYLVEYIDGTDHFMLLIGNKGMSVVFLYRFSRSDKIFQYIEKVKSGLPYFAPD